LKKKQYRLFQALQETQKSQQTKNVIFLKKQMEFY